MNKLVVSIFMLLTSININAQSCDLFTYDLEISECDESLYDISFKLLPHYVVVDDIVVVVNGSSVQVDSSDGRFIIQGITSMGQGVEVIEVCLTDMPECCDTINYTSPCECHFSNIHTEIVECNEEDEEFYFWLDFDYQMTSDSFLLGSSNMNFGTFSFDDLPIFAGPIQMSDEEYELLILDQINPFCFSSYDLGVVNGCELLCNVSEPNIWISPCSVNDEVYIEFSFDYENTSIGGFVLRGNGMIYDTFQYGQNNYIYGPLTADCESIGELVFVDLTHPDCQIGIDFIEPLCCEEDCIIAEVIAEAYECEEGNNLILVDIAFDYEGMVGDSFEIRGNGMSYGYFIYGEEYYTIGPIEADCETLYEFIIIDGSMESCSGEYGFEEPLCCEEDCILYDISIDPLECDGEGTYSLILNFEYSGANGDTFEVWGAGQYLGAYALSDLPVMIDNFPEREVEYDIIEICLNDVPECCLVYEFMGLDCMDMGDCIIAEVIAEAYECEEGNNLILVDIAFDYEGMVGDSFEIRGNGMSYGYFMYGEEYYTIGPIEADCETLYEFIIIDGSMESCSGEYGFEEPLCCEEDCVLYDISIDPLECDGEGTYSLVLDFEYEGTTNTYFEVWGSDEYLGQYEFSDLPLTIENFPERDVEYDIIKICENDNPDCCLIHEFMGLDCSGSATYDISKSYLIYQVGETFVISENYEELLLFDLSGKQVLIGNGGHINASGLVSGVYFYQLRIEDRINIGKVFKY